MKEIFKSLLASTTNSLSSKRFCGLLGWLVLMGCLGYATFEGTELPGITTEFIIGTVTLLGVDSITSIWKKKDKGPAQDEDNNEENYGGI